MSVSIAGSNIVQCHRRDFTLVPEVIGGLVACADATVMFCTGYIIFMNGSLGSIENLPMNLSAMALYSMFISVLFYTTNLYKIESIVKRRTDFSKIFLICTLTFTVFLTFAVALKASSSFSFKWLIQWFFASITGICIVRLLARECLIAWAKSGRLAYNIAIVGGGEHGALMMDMLKKQQLPWVKVIGVFDDRSERLSQSIEGNLKLGNVDNLVSLARDLKVDEILVALPWGAESRILTILNKLQVLPVNIRLCPEGLCFKLPNNGFSFYNGIPTLNMLDKPLSGWGYVIKSIEDKILGLIILTLIAPVLLVIAIMVKLDSPGPVLFRQKRYGFNNQLIDMYKFRSMYVDKQDNNASQLTTRNDPRVTKLGRFLRRTSLDELPQFLNVLTGEMSIVGPRPHATEAKAAGVLYEDVVHQYAARHKVKPGITGWAQVNGWRGDTDTKEKIQKRVDYDIDYINRWSLFFDLKIILKTVFVVIVGQNAY